MLVGTAGLARLRVDAATLAATVGWMAHPSGASSTRLVRRFLAPEVIARGRGIATVVASGQHDVFVAPQRLRRPACAGLGVEVVSIADAGHFVTDERPTAIVELVGRVRT